MFLSERRRASLVGGLLSLCCCWLLSERSGIRDPDSGSSLPCSLGSLGSALLLLTDALLPLDFTAGQPTPQQKEREQQSGFGSNNPLARHPVIIGETAPRSSSYHI